MPSTENRLLPLTLLLCALCGCGTVQPDDDLSCSERSLIAESRGDSLVIAGRGEAARDEYIRAALLRAQDDSLRWELSWKAALASPSRSLITAQLLLERPDSLAPYIALELGGRDIVPGLISHVSRYGCVMPEYLHLVLADTLISSGDAEGALAALEAVPAGLPERASERRTLIEFRALLRTGDTVRADSLFARAEGAGDDELLSLLCHYRGIWMAERGLEGYRDVFLRSFRLWPAAPVHAAAYDMLRTEIISDGSFGASLADDFYTGGLWNELFDIASNSDDPDPHLFYLAARTRDRLGFYDIAVTMLEDCLERWPGAEDTPDAMINLGRNLGRSGCPEEGLQVLQSYGDEFPDHSRAGNLPWYMGDLLAENGQWGRAIPWFRLTLEKYPGNVTADDAHFYLCFALMKTGDISGAISELESFISRWTGSVYLSSAKYWLGKLLYTEGNPRGREVLEGLIASAPYSLPACFARELLGLPPWEPLFTEEPLAQWMQRNGNPPVQPPEETLRGLFLQNAGLRYFADGEFKAGEEKVGGPQYLAPFYLENRVWERRPISGYNIWDISGDEADRPRELWMLRYQMAWPELVVPAGERYGLDSLFAWAIIRNESMFQPGTYSVAGARGLIQMIPSTSEYVAIENGWDDYSPDRLYDPAVSIEYGISYISDISREFGGDPVVTAAAYNGGPHNALNWGAPDLDTDEFFSLITYNETRTYTQNVYHAYMIYRALYE
ncbi:MAG: transglycosylase SLT domain-containing protein [Candidatus Fermentibacteraceae bacterium]|nr:transglycosylase SLT domain-containing protein [Candidatus Fermentibacteraceae bacterium]